MKGMTKPKGYWTPERMREYLLKFAKDNNLDPFAPASWANSFHLFIKSEVSSFHELLIINY